MSNPNINDNKDETHKVTKPDPHSQLGFWQRFHGPILLTLVGGAIDTIGFVGLLGFFTNHVTGNLVTAGSAIVKNDNSLWIDLSVLPVFIITVMLTKRFIDRSDSKSPILSRLLFTEVAFLTAFMVSALYFGPFSDAGAVELAFTGFLGLMAFAIRNTAGKTVMGKMSPTLLMTGNTTKLGMDLSDYVFNRNECNMNDLQHSLALVMSFVTGAFLGTILYIWIGFWSIAPFILPVLYLAFATRDEDYRKSQQMHPK